MQSLQDLIRVANDLVILTRPFVEWLSFAGTVGLFFVALYGLKQIRLLKLDILTRSERSAKEKSIEASEKFWLEYTVNYMAYSLEVRKRNAGPYKDKIGEFKPTEFPEYTALPDYTKTRIGLYNLWLKSSNRIEAIAAMFITGVADEETGFSVMGLDFVEMVQNEYDQYTYAQKSTSGQKQYFSNTIKLYRAWAPRFTQKELELQKKNLEEKIRTLERPKIQSLTPDIA